MKTIIKNALVMLDDISLTSICMNDDIISEIGDKLDETGAKVIDAKGNYVLPGFIDMNCDICDPGLEKIEDIGSASHAAARGGFTTITANPNTMPVIDNKTVVQYVVSKSKLVSKINVYPYGSMTKDCKGKEMAEIGEMRQFGIVAISDGKITVNDTRILKNIFLYSKMFDLPVITFCEDVSLTGNGVINEGYLSTRLGLAGIPSAAEEVIVARNLSLANHIGNKLHLMNITTKGSVQLIREAKKRGVTVTAETSPLYFTLTEDNVGEYNTLYKVNPPLRTQEDISAIIEGLSDGTIDVISSGHKPSTFEEKNIEFDKASNGISALETAFPISFTYLVLGQKLSLKELSCMMSSMPAKILNLHSKGKIDKGYDADVVIVDKTKQFEVDASKFCSKAKFSPYNGRMLRGKIIKTFVSGKEVY